MYIHIPIYKFNLVCIQKAFFGKCLYISHVFPLDLFLSLFVPQTHMQPSTLTLFLWKIPNRHTLHTRTYTIKKISSFLSMILGDPHFYAIFCAEFNKNFIWFFAYLISLKHSPLSFVHHVHECFFFAREIVALNITTKNLFWIKFRWFFL